MKNIYLTLLISFFAVLSSATTRTTQQKIAIAESVLDGHVQMAKAKGGVRVHPTELKSLNNLSVIGYSDGGFVVVSNDDQMKPVVGYSDGRFDELSNPSLKWYLAAANEALSKSTDHTMNVVAPSQYNNLKSEVSPLVTSTWNQGNPYYLYTPTYGKNNSHYVTGCVATAMSQVMYFHKYPSQGRNTHTYNFTSSSGNTYKLSVDYSKETYNWSLMVDNYIGNESEASQMEVAKLMYDTGVSCNMQYNEDGSGAYTFEAANALVDYFNYNENLQLYTRSVYSEGLWMQKIYTELNNNRPIMYAGSDANGGGGHEFVLDGYNADGLVHINWGWGGNADGYYDIALLNPSSYKFSVGQEMVMGIAKPDVDIIAETQMASNGDVSFIPSSVTPNVMSVNCTITNLGRNRYIGPAAVVLIDEAGNQQVAKYFTDKTKSGSDTAVNYDLFHGNSESLTIRTLRYGDILSSKPDGKYRFLVGTLSNNRWCPVHALEGKVNSVVITKKGDTYTLSNDTDDLWMSSVTSSATTGIRSINTNSKIPNTDAIYNLSGVRVGNDYKGVVIKNGKKFIKK